MEELRQFLSSLSYWGPLGAFAIAFLDSSILPLIHVVDIIVIARGAAGDPDAWWFAAAAVVGSVAGLVALQRLSAQGRKAPWLRNLPAERLNQLRERLERSPTLVLLPAAAIPAPFPMKALVIAAGVLKMNPWRFGVTMAVGRVIRYFGLIWLGKHYGEAMLGGIREYGWWIVCGVAAVATLFALRAWKRGKTQPA